MLDFKKKILLGDFAQKVHIKTLNEDNPVLLFRHSLE